MPLEVVPGVKHVAGVLSMGRFEDPHSGTSSFSILLGPAPHLDMQVRGVVGRGVLGGGVCRGLHRGNWVHARLPPSSCSPQATATDAAHPPSAHTRQYTIFGRGAPRARAHRWDSVHS